MVKVKGAGPKTRTVTKVAPKAEAPKPKETAEQKAAKVAHADLEESIGRHPGGMEPPVSEEAKKAALDAQFAHADGVGDPRVDELAAGLAVRGY